MKLLSLLLSATLLTSTAAVASAARPSEAPRKPTIDHRFAPQSVVVRDHRVRPPISKWQRLSLVRTKGTKSTLELARKHAPIDALRLDVTRGTLNVKKVVVFFTDGSKYVAKVGTRLGAGDSKLIQIPGAARKVARIEVRYGKNTRAQLAISAR